MFDSLLQLSPFLSWIWVTHSIHLGVKAWLDSLKLRIQNRKLECIACKTTPKRVALVIAVKGVSENFEVFVKSIFEQKYPCYRIIFTVESTKDPAYSAISALLEKEDPSRPETSLVVASLATDSSQKIQNQLAAFETLVPEDEIIAFADVDIADRDDWLLRLVTPLNGGLADFSSGYRWLVPSRQTLSNLMASSLNTSLAMLAHPQISPIMWGGSMAATRQVFDELDLPAIFKGNISDSMLTTEAAKKNRKRVFFVRSLMPPTPVNYTWGELFEFVRRQAFYPRIHFPLLCSLGFFVASTYIVGAIATLVCLLNGEPSAWLPLGLVVGFDLIKNAGRETLYRQLFSRETLHQLFPSRVFQIFSGPLNIIYYWVVLISIAFRRNVVWAGVRYRVFGPKNLKVVSRS